MKKYTAILIIFFISSLYIKAQEKVNVISLTPVVFRSSENISPRVSKMLLNKMKQVLTKHGVSSINKRGEQIIYPSIIVMSKNLTSTAPPKLFVNLEVTFYIADYDRKLIYTSEVFNLKGVGRTEEQAYITAIKSLNKNNKKFEEFIKKGKDDIVNYYNSNCNLIIENANALAKQNQYENALSSLSKIPSSSDCYSIALSSITKIYQLYDNYNCNKNLAKANSIWAAEQNSQGAKKASYYLSLILPNSNCSKDADKLVAEIKSKIRENENKEWDFKMKSTENNNETKEVLLEAYKSLIEHVLSTQKNRNYNYTQFNR